MVIIALYAGMSGWYVWRREVEAMKATYERDRAELRQELAYWRDRAWSFSRIAEQVSAALPTKDQA